MRHPLAKFTLTLCVAATALHTQTTGYWRFEGTANKGAMIPIVDSTKFAIHGKRWRAERWSRSSTFVVRRTCSSLLVHLKSDRWD
jgi:hypothetical protein